MSEQQDVNEVVDGIYLRNGKRLYISDADNERAVAAFNESKAKRHHAEEVFDGPPKTE